MRATVRSIASGLSAASVCMKPTKPHMSSGPAFRVYRFVQLLVSPHDCVERKVFADSFASTPTELAALRGPERNKLGECICHGSGVARRHHLACRADDRRRIADIR